ncbi:MAG: lytic transglycosylase domain-containing protein [Candidatus Poribacteria bacterium]|nr:lytic transglycosylase domain-containing protein [Candidatus Poribacteria bacterium]
MILHLNRNAFAFSLAGLAFLLYFSVFANARVKHVYKLMLMDYRGNTKIEYTTSDPSTYIVYNGGSALIKGFRVLERWSVHVDASLYGQSLVDLDPAKYRKAVVSSSLNATRSVSPSATTVMNAQMLQVNDNSSRTSPLATTDINSDLLNNSFVGPRLAARQNKDRFAKVGGFGKTTRVSHLVTPGIQGVAVTSVDGETADISQETGLDLSQPLTVIPKANELGKSIYAGSVSTQRKDLAQKDLLVKKLDSTVLRRLRRYDRLITHAAAQNGLDPNLLKALVYIESAGNYKAVSPKRAMGLTQLRIPTAREMGVKNVFNPQQNLLGGAKYLSQQLKAFKNESTALAAYNAGPTRVRRGNTLPTETRSYVKRVLAVRNILASR